MAEAGDLRRGMNDTLKVPAGSGVGLGVARGLALLDFPLDLGANGREVERLAQDHERADFGRPAAQAELQHPGHDPDRHLPPRLRFQGRELTAKFEPVHPRHVDVHQSRIEGVLGRQLQRRRSGISGEDRVAAVPESRAEHASEGRVVVDDENGVRHERKTVSEERFGEGG
jgi:hypothetical protein